jgi:lactoylglutathione lyase
MITTKFSHINIVSRNWKKLADFYVTVFNCVPKLPERNLYGKWLDDLTNIDSAHIKGIHLLLPGYKEDGPTIEIFEYNQSVETKRKTKRINKEGFTHIAFSVSNVEKCLKLVKEKGGSEIGKVVKKKIKCVGKIEVVYAKDPEGNIIEIQKWE